MRASRVYITCTFILFLCTLVYVQSGEPPSLRKKINGLLILLLLLLLLLLLIKNYPLFENFSFQFSQHNPKKFKMLLNFRKNPFYLEKIHIMLISGYSVNVFLYLSE